MAGGAGGGGGGVGGRGSGGGGVISVPAHFPTSRFFQLPKCSDNTASCLSKVISLRKISRLYRFGTHRTIYGVRTDDLAGNAPQGSEPSNVD